MCTKAMCREPMESPGSAENSLNGRPDAVRRSRRSSTDRDAGAADTFTELNVNPKDCMDRIHDQKMVGLFETEQDLSEPVWTKLEVVMDSGAAESVAPADLAPWVRVKSLRCRDLGEYI